MKSFVSFNCCSIDGGSICNYFSHLRLLEITRNGQNEGCVTNGYTSVSTENIFV